MNACLNIADTQRLLRVIQSPSICLTLNVWRRYSNCKGYPLWTLLAHSTARIVEIFSPSSSFAWRVGVLSACLHAAAAAFMYLVIYEASEYLATSRGGILGAKQAPTSTYIKAAATFASALWAFSPTVWTYSIQAEVGINQTICVSSLS